MTKVAIIAGGADYRNLFISLGMQVVDDLRNAELICFTGGADVSPTIYGDKQHQYTYNDEYRDEKEALYFNYARENNIPMVGICRGAQFLNVMSGGRMYQHVSEHTRAHSMTDVETGETIYVSSTHHQMMMPSEAAIIVATAHLGGTREWFDGAVAKRDISKEDIEVVFYPETKSFCFQPHPEFNSPEYEGMKAYFAQGIVKYLGVK